MPPHVSSTVVLIIRRPKLLRSGGSDGHYLMYRIIVDILQCYPQFIIVYVLIYIKSVFLWVKINR